MAFIPDPEEPCYLISVAARMVRAHPQTLRRYEELGLIKPARLSGRRFYSLKDIERLRKIIYLTDELGVNLAGVEIILNLNERIEKMQQEMSRMEQEIQRLREQLANYNQEEVKTS